MEGLSFRRATDIDAIVSDQLHGGHWSVSPLVPASFRVMLAHSHTQVYQGHGRMLIVF
jgi:hypothetical protein